MGGQAAVRHGSRCARLAKSSSRLAGLTFSRTARCADRRWAEHAWKDGDSRAEVTNRRRDEHESVQSHGWTKGEVCLEAQLQVGRPHRQDARQENRRHRHRTKTRRRPLGDVARRHHLRSGGTGQGERKGHSQRGSFEKRECGGARTRRQETPAAGSSPQQDFGGRRHDMNRHDRLRCALSA